MSTRSTVIYSTNTGNHIWEETNEPVDFFGKFMGYNIHGEIDFSELKSVKAVDGDLKLEFIKDSFFDFVFPGGLTLHGHDLLDFEVDNESVAFGIKGGSYTYKQIMEGKNESENNFRQLQKTVISFK